MELTGEYADCRGSIPLSVLSSRGLSDEITNDPNPATARTNYGFSRGDGMWDADYPDPAGLGYRADGDNNV
jgi:hypothetical protein